MVRIAAKYPPDAIAEIDSRFRSAEGDNTRQAPMDLPIESPSSEIGFVEHPKRWLMPTRRTLFLFLMTIVWGLIVPSIGGTQGNSGFKVVVNVGNPTPSMSRKNVAKLFLKKSDEWANGFSVSVVDQIPETEVRHSFSVGVLKKDTAAVEAYWNKLIFSGMASPPLRLPSDQEVIDFVGSNVGSIGYVSGEAALGPNVRELEVTQ